ncbi:ABC transporter ATP-binding protein, partial [Myxococcota bacterium]|nr:ABC transporter ATP-binding protein [Myxococcota bacterium]
MDLSPRENLEFFAGAQGLRGRARKIAVEAALNRADLRDRSGQRAGDLPGGLRQRLALASARLHAPSVLFLDEPTAGVAPDARREFWREIRAVAAQGTTVFVTTHHLDEAEYCARVGLMVDGRLKALDTPAGLKATHAPGRFLTIEGAPKAAMRAAPGLMAVEPFGLRLRARFEAAAPLADPARCAAWLADQGIAARVERAEATLEDVFLALVGVEVL